MTDLVLDFCADDNEATAARARREAEGYSIVGVVPNVEMVLRYPVSMTAGAVPIPQFGSAKKYYPDTNTSIQPPRFVVVSTFG